MKKIVCILLVLCYVMSMQIVSAKATSNLILEYNFEDSLATTMSTWSYYTSESEGKITVNTTNYTEGKSSIRVTDDDASASIGILSPKKTVTPGSLFKISFDGYLHSGKSFAIVRFYKTDGTYLASDDILIRLSEKNVWKTYEHEKFIPSYAATCRIFLLSYSTDLGDASFDNIVMSATTTSNLISEYNFEDSLATTMSTWSYYTSESEGKITVNTTNYTEGKSSIRVTDDDASASIGILSPKKTVTPGSLFKISFDGYLHSGKSFAIVRFYKTDGTYLASDDILIRLSEKNVWKTYEHEKFIPSYAATCRIFLLSYSTDLGDASFDNIVMSATTTSNLIEEYNFEDSLATTMSTWSYYTSESEGKITVNTTNYTEGKSSIRVTDDDASASIGILSPKKTVTPGSLFKISFDGYLHSGKSFAIVRFYKTDGTYLASDDILIRLSEKNVWKTYEHEKFIPFYAATCRIFLLSYSTDLGDASFDNIVMSATTTANVISEYNFEDSLTTTMSAWSYYSSASKGKIAVNTTNYTEGKSSIRVTDDDTSVSIGISSPKNKVTPGTLFKISFDGYLHSGKSLALVRFYKSDGTYLTSDDIQIYLSEKNAWKTYGYEKYLPSYVTDYKIYLLSYSTNIGDASYDNIKVYQGELNSINNKTGFIAPIQNNAVNAQIVSPDGGNLVYSEYDGKGGKLTDFSHAGFYGGKYEIPDSDNLMVGAVINPYAWSNEEITAKTADDTARIQSVIDNVSSLYPDNKMTVIKLKAGKYYISSVGLSLPSGIVLSGEGQGPTGTILYAYEANNSDSSMVIKVIGNAHQKGTHNCYITDSYVPSGSNKITLSSYDASFFNVGDTFIIHYESTDEWTESIGMSSPIINVYDTDTGWGANDVVKIHEREITSINGNEITFDIPLEMHLDNKLMPAYIYKINTDARVRNSGIENLRIESYFDPTITGSTGYVDENHSKYLIYFKHAQDCYVENVTTKYIYFSGIYFGNYAKRITARNCSSLEPVSLIEGNRRYPFLCTAFSQQILVTGCYSEKGRHDYATTHRASGPTAYVDNVADNSFAISEPHATWSTGILYDNIYHVGSDSKGYIGITNRGIYGTDISQGWTGVGCVVWNSLANTIAAHDVPGDYQNFLVGNWGTYKDLGAMQRKDDNIVTMADMYRKTEQVGGTDANMATSSDTSLVGDAYKEAGTAPVNPRSLFKAQLALRITGDYRNQKPNAPVLTYPKSDELFSTSLVHFYGLYQKGATGVNIYVDDVKHNAILDSSQNTFKYSLDLSEGVHKIYTTQVVDGIESNKSADRFVIIKNQGNYTNTLSSNYSHKTLSLISQDTRMTFDEYLDTVSDVIEISDAQGFKAIASGLSGSYKLIESIDLSNCDYVAISGFKGTLDGNGYTVNLGNNANQGIFKDASNFTIKNLIVKGAINTTEDAGAFVGAATGTCTFINCKNFADVTGDKGAAYIGGILGNGFDNCTALTFENCINHGTIKANYTNNSNGGILGVGKNTTIKTCVNYGIIDGKRRSGGLIGWSTGNLDLSNCANFGYISSEGENINNVGGAIGILRASDSTGSIKNFLNAGQVINGVAGSDGTYTKPFSISNCINVGKTTNAMNNLSGATISNCYFLEGTGEEKTGATSKTSNELKELILEGYAKQEGFDYPLPSGIEYVTKEDALIIRISTAEEFKNIKNEPSGSYKLISDITLSEGLTEPFRGIFDGNGHTITIGSETNPATQGVFATVSNATIKNLTVKGSINATENVGAFAGAATGTSTFINCTNFADVTGDKGAAYIGGILGNGFDSCDASIFENCINYGTIKVNYVNNSNGGILGVGRNTTIKTCVNYGRIDGQRYAGGLIGWSTANLELLNCANFGYVSSVGDNINYVGGVFGHISSYPKGSIKNFFNAGQVINGVAGSNGINATSLSISNCVNTGTTINAMTNMAGVSISNCYFLESTGSDSTGATSKTSDELKELILDGYAKQVRYEYPLPSGIVYVTKEDAASLVLISTTAEFMNIKNDLSGNYVLTKDIDLSNCDYVAISGFKGVLDGNGYTISLGNNAKQGVFATVNNATIKNLIVKGSINATENVGAFAGTVIGTGTFINCTNFADVTGDKGAAYIGGILGNGFDSCAASIFENCINYGTIKVNYVNNSNGGILGVGRNTTIKTCVNYGRIDGQRYAGGLIGWSTANLELLNCANFGYVSSVGDNINYVGGVFGHISSYPKGSIKNFFNAGQVINGVAGSNGINATSLSISNCINIGTTINAMTNMADVKTSNCYFLAGTGEDKTGAASKTSAQLKVLDITDFTVPTGIYGVEYPVPSVLALTTNNVTVTASKGGSVSPSGTVKVIYGASVTFKATPDDGYYADCSYNGADIILNNENLYTTPAITKDASFEANFAKLADVDVSHGLLMYTPYITSLDDMEYYGENGSVIVFAKAAKFGPVTVTECGLLLDTTNSMTNDELVYDGKGVRVLPFDLDTYSLTENGCYGILIYNNYFTQSKNYKIRAYAKYSNGNITYTEPSRIKFDAIN